MSKNLKKEMVQEYRKKDSMINLYSILGLTEDVCEKPDCAELIKTAYLEKSRLTHPDKNKGNPEMADVFQMIQGAYEILSDPKMRANYNNKLNMDKQSSSSFFKLKQAAEDYSNNNGYIEATDQQKLDFEKKMLSINETRGHASFKEEAISKKDAKNLLKDRLADRASDDINYKPEQLFKDVNKDFDAKKFNAAFDLQKKQGNVINNMSILEAPAIPSAWNTGSQFGSFYGDEGLGNLEDPFDDSGSNFGFASHAFGSYDASEIPKNTMTRKMMKKMDNADYYEDHNKLEEDYHSALKKKLAERNNDSTLFQNMTYKDYKRDDMAGYGILDQIGYTDTEHIGMLDELTVSEKLDKLMKERNMM